MGCIAYFQPDGEAEIAYDLPSIQDGLRVVEMQRRFFETEEAWKAAKKYFEDGLAAWMRAHHPNHKPH